MKRTLHNAIALAARPALDADGPRERAFVRLAAAQTSPRLAKLALGALEFARANPAARDRRGAERDAERIVRDFLSSALETGAVPWVVAAWVRWADEVAAMEREERAR